MNETKSTRQSTRQTCTCESERISKDTLQLRLGGDWVMQAERPSREDVLREMAEEGIRRLGFATDSLGTWDSGLLVFLGGIMQEARARDVEIDSSGLPAGVRRLLDLATAVPERQGARRTEKRDPVLARIGTRTLGMAKGLEDALTFLGECAMGLSRLFRGRAQFRRSDLALFVEDCGSRSLPIVTLISFLVGVILAFVGAIQLVMFGAQIYVANMVVVGMAVEMGALMTGIIMAGRIGASYAAQLGTMQVNEEIDALKTMGISPIDFLVLPRMLALVLMMPLLCIFANAMGILGGAVIGIGTLDIEAVQYFIQSKEAVQLRHFAQGLIKSSVFGVLIAIAGCYRGIQCGRSASAVGEATTAAVVTCIVLIVISDAVLTIIYSVTGF